MMSDLENSEVEAWTLNRPPEATYSWVLLLFEPLWRRTLSAWSIEVVG